MEKRNKSIEEFGKNIIDINNNKKKGNYLEHFSSDCKKEPDFSDEEKCMIK